MLKEGGATYEATLQPLRASDHGGGRETALPCGFRGVEVLPRRPATALGKVKMQNTVAQDNVYQFS